MAKVFKTDLADSEREVFWEQRIYLKLPTPNDHKNHFTGEVVESLTV